jgi:flagellar motor protein MotB
MNTISANHQIGASHQTRYGRESTATRRSNRQTWMVSFADLMAILLTFMVMTFSTKELNDTSWKSMNQSMKVAFGSPLVSDRQTSAPTPISLLAGISSDGIVAELIEARFPDLAGDGNVRISAEGVEVGLENFSSDTSALDNLAGYLVSLNKPLTVKVETSLPGSKTGSVQRMLAWERGVATAFDLRTRLMDQHLAQRRPGTLAQSPPVDPRISVVMVDGPARTRIVVASVEEEGA